MIFIDTLILKDNYLTFDTFFNHFLSPSILHHQKFDIHFLFFPILSNFLFLNLFIYNSRVTIVIAMGNFTVLCSCSFVFLHFSSIIIFCLKILLTRFSKIELMYYTFMFFLLLFLFTILIQNDTHRG